MSSDKLNMGICECHFLRSIIRPNTENFDDLILSSRFHYLYPFKLGIFLTRETGAKYRDMDPCLGKQNNLVEPNGDVCGPHEPPSCQSFEESKGSVLKLHSSSGRLEECLCVTNAEMSYLANIIGNAADDIFKQLSGSDSWVPLSRIYNASYHVQPAQAGARNEEKLEGYV